MLTIERNSTRVVKGIALLLVICVLASCGITHSVDRIHRLKGIKVKVVDAQTGEPLEGVIMLAYWSTYYFRQGGPNDIVAVSESVSDAEGWVRVKGQFIRLPFQESVNKSRNPAFVLYKSGYEDYLLNNSVVGATFYKGYLREKLSGIQEYEPRVAITGYGME